MREIKFRAWDKNNEVMIYSEDNQNDDFTFIAERGGLHFYYIDSSDRYLMDTYSFLMQYTGLKDKNGREIYEGDIVIYKYASYGDISVVEYDIDRARFQMKAVREHENTSWSEFDKGRLHSFYNVSAMGMFDYVKVIGNIYENPELLEGDNE